MILEHIDRNYDAAYYAGEPIVLEYQETDAAGAVMSLTGRSFVLSIFRSEDPTFGFYVAGDVSDDGTYVTVALDGQTSRTFNTVRDGRYELAELDGNVKTGVLLAGRLSVEEGSRVQTLAAAFVPAAPISRIVRQVIANRPRVVVTQRGAYGRTGVQGPQGLPGGYTLVPDPDGLEQTLELQAAFDAPFPPDLPPGATFFTEMTRVPVDQPAVLMLGARVAWRLLGRGMGITHRWDGSTDARIAETLGKPLLLITDWTDGSEWSDVTFDYSPAPQVMSDIVSFEATGGAKTGIVFRPRDGETVGFCSADKLVSYVPVYDDAGTVIIGEKPGPWTYTRQRVNGNRVSAPGPIVNLNNGTYAIRPIPVTFNLEQVKSLNPLTMRSSDNTFVNGQQIIPNNVQGLSLGGTSQVNGRTFSILLGQSDSSDDEEDDDKSDKDFRFYDVDTGAAIDATTWTTYVDGTGTATGIPVPNFFKVGAPLELVCRKRASNGAIINRCDGIMMRRVRWKHTTALGVVGALNKDPYFEGWIYDHSAAGGILLNDTIGTFRAHNMTFRNMGDCSLASRTTDWTPSIVAFDQVAGTIRVQGWNTGDFKSKLPAPTQPGYTLGLLRAGVPIMRLVVQSVNGVDVTFTTPLPLDYSPTTYTTVPFEWACAVDVVGGWDLRDSCSSGFAVQSPHFVFDAIKIKNCRTGGLRVAMSGTGQPGSSGAVNGLRGGLFLVEESCSKEPRTRDTPLTLRQTDNYGNVANMPQGLERAHYIDVVDIDGVDYGTLGVHDRSLTVGVYRQRRTLRVVPPAGAAPAALYNLAATNGANITLLQVDGEMPTSNGFGTSGPGNPGFVTIGSGSKLVATGTLAAGGVAVTAAKPVRVGDETKLVVIVGGVIQAPGNYVANGTATLTFTSAPYLSGGPVPYTVTHVGC